MLDMLDDTFKLTIDPLFHGAKTLSPQEVEQQTEYELMYSQELNVNKRTKLGLTKRTQADNTRISNELNVESFTLQSSQVNGQKDVAPQTSIFKEFSEDLYPSKIIYQKLMKNQAKHLEKWKA